MRVTSTSPTERGAEAVVSITITLPMPPAVLSPNARPFWAVRASAAKAMREAAAHVTRQAIWQDGITDHPWPAARIDVWWLFAGVQPDADNCIARLKSAIDGIADACIVANDNVIQLGAVQFERVKRKEQGVVLTLTRKGGTE